MPGKCLWNSKAAEFCELNPKLPLVQAVIIVALVMTVACYGLWTSSGDDHLAVRKV